MDDAIIVQLYWDRNEQAISATADKYGQYCSVIADNILGNSEDAEECVNDTYMKAWNAIPPSRPNRLATYLGKITRNLAFDKFKHNKAEKRGGGELPIILDELAECVSGKESVENEFDRKTHISAIDAFLETLPKQKQMLFIRRYWYSDSVSDIATRYSLSAGSVAMQLSRMRKSMRIYLTERGFDI